LSDEEINRYLDTQEPYDKAGAYGIQGTAGLFVKAIHGCYFNIMGLPLQKVYEILRDEFGFSFHWS
jgi:septum formation protein